MLTIFPQWMPKSDALKGQREILDKLIYKAKKTGGVGKAAKYCGRVDEGTEKFQTRH